MIFPSNVKSAFGNYHKDHGNNSCYLKDYSPLFFLGILSRDLVSFSLRSPSYLSPRAQCAINDAILLGWNTFHSLLWELGNLSVISERVCACLICNNCLGSHLHGDDHKSKLIEQACNLSWVCAIPSRFKGYSRELDCSWVARKYAINTLLPVCYNHNSKWAMANKWNYNYIGG